jgi:small-conductance mechanosensitive channel
VLLLLALLALLTTALPALSRDASTAYITVDGRRLFRVEAASEYSAETRVEGINRALADLVRSDRPARIEVEQRNNLPVISVDGQTLLTVTARDTPEWRTQQEQAEDWRRRLEAAVAEGRRERRPEVVRGRLVQAAAALAAALLLQWGLTAARRRLPRQRRRWALVRLSLWALQGGIWLAAAMVAADGFPASRVWSRNLLNAVGDSLTAPVLPLGERSYSLLDAIILISLFVALFRLVGVLQAVLRGRVLRHTGISLGAQEAIVFLLRYGLLLLGSLVLLQLWGLDLSSLTLFAGVLGVGVGLGLQGITKNFVSGLVIMFERPIQVGDFVEIGDLEGTVKQVNLRSTEVVTLDAISIIVPNSEFLESRVVNWSHGSPISRLRVPVGVAYGSDPQAVRSALVEACEDHPDVLKQPPPRVFFTGFGDSSLDFQLLAWISQPMRQYDIRSDLNFRIEAALRRHGITIPFPQRDLHLRGGALPIELPQELSEALRRWIGHGGGESAPPKPIP